MKRTAALASCAAALMLVATPASAAMTVATFLAKAQALKAKGVGAMFSSDLGLLKREGKAAGEAVRAERAARLKAGQAPAYCPPGRKGAMGADVMIAGLAAIPVAQRGIPLKDGMRRVLATRFPCR